MIISDLKIDGIDYIAIKNISIFEQVQNHGICRLTLIPDKKFDVKKIIQLNKQKITVKADKDIIFCGFISNCDFEKIDGNFLLNLTALSLSSQLNSAKKTFSMQSAKKKVSDVLKEVEKNYKPAEFSFWKDDAVKDFIYCDNLTDWDFLTEFARSRGQILFTDSKTDKLRISVGFKAFKEFTDDKVTKSLQLLNTEISMDFFKKLEQNTYSSARSAYFIENTFLTDDLKIGAGYGVKYDNQTQAVISSKIFLQKDVLFNEIKIRHAEGVRADAFDVVKTFDRRYFLTGKVLEAKDTWVKVQFDCDQKQDKNDALEIPFESAASNYLFSLPDEGEKVLVYSDNIRLAAMTSLRAKDVSDAADKKSFRTKNSELNFDNEKISFTAEKKVELTESDGVKLTAKKDILISSKGDILIQSSGSVLPDGQLTMIAPMSAGQIAYTALGGAPPSVQFNPAGSTVGKIPSSIQNSGAKKTDVELSDIAKELDKLTNRQDKKFDNKKSSGGGGGSLKLEGKKSAIIQVKDSSIEMKDKDLNVKTRALFQAGYIPSPGGGTGSLSKFEGGSPKNRSDKIKLEHGAQDRKRSAEKLSPVPDNKNISG